MTTNKYHARFGHLAYEAEAGTSFQILSDSEVLDYSELPIVYTETASYRIPSEVYKAGTVELTAAIHSSASSWLKAITDSRKYGEGLFLSAQIDHGADDEITLHCRRAVAEDTGFSNEIRKELDELLETERQRLQQQMTEAINRMIQLVYE